MIGPAKEVARGVGQAFRIVGRSLKWAGDTFGYDKLGWVLASAPFLPAAIKIGAGLRTIAGGMFLMTRWSIAKIVTGFQDLAAASLAGGLLASAMAIGALAGALKLIDDASPGSIALLDKLRPDTYGPQKPMSEIWKPENEWIIGTNAAGASGQLTREWIKPFHIGWIDGYYAMMDDFRAKVNAKWEELLAGFKTMPGQLATAAGELGTAFVSAVGTMKTNLLNAWDGLKNGTIAKFNEIKATITGFVKALPGLIRDGLGDLASIGAEWIGSLWTGMKSELSSILGWIGGIGDQMRDALGNLNPFGETPAAPAVPPRGSLPPGLLNGPQRQGWLSPSSAPSKVASVNAPVHIAFNVQGASEGDFRRYAQMAANAVRDAHRKSLNDGIVPQAV